MAYGQWWQRPQLITADSEPGERKVTWLELFFDLVFVVVISELAHFLSSHISISGALGYILLFIPVWWTWIGGTWYNARFETTDLSYRFITYLQMLPVAAMAIFAHDGLGHTSAHFAGAYIAGRLIIIALWVRASRHEPRFRPVGYRYAIGFSISAAMFTASLLVPPPWRFVLWGVGLLSDLVTPISTLGMQARLPRLSNEKLPERLGLLVIIVLGEAIVGVIRGLAQEDATTLTTAVRGALGMALVFSLWWIYFDFTVRHSPFREPKPGPWWTFTWVYLHLPLVMGVAATGAGIMKLLQNPTLLPETRWLLVCATAVTLTVIGLIELTLRREEHEPTHLVLSPAMKFGGAAFILMLGLFGALTPTLFLGLLLLPLIVQMVYGAYTWYHSPLAVPNHGTGDLALNQANAGQPTQ